MVDHGSREGCSWQLKPEEGIKVNVINHRLQLTQLILLQKVLRVSI